MTNNRTILAIFLGIVVFAGSVSFSFAENEIISNMIQSPKKQLEQGVLPEEIQCREDRILVNRDNGGIACVRESTAEKKNWEILKVDFTITETNPQHDEIVDIAEVISSVKTSDAKITVSNYQDNDAVISELGSSNFWPQYNLTFPEQVRIGEPFDVVLDYSYIVPDIDAGYEDYEKRCEEYSCGDINLHISRPDYVELINRSDYELISRNTNTEYLPHRTGESGFIPDSFDNTGPQQETFTFVINEPTIDYNYGAIYSGFYNMDPIYFHVSNNGIVYLSDQKMESIGEGPGQLKEDLSNLTYTTRAERIAQQVGSEPSIEEFADFLSEYYPSEDFEQLLASMNFTQGYIDRFFEQNPEMRTQSFVPSLHWILPQAFGDDPSSFTFVTGTLKNHDVNGSIVPVYGATVCAYDNEGSTLTELYNGPSHICEVTRIDGTFSFAVPYDDPNGSGNTDLILRAFAQNSDFVIYKNLNNAIHRITDNNVDSEISEIYEDYGDFIIQSSQISSKAFWVINELQPVRDWYVDTLRHDPAKSNIIWDPTKCEGVGVDPNSKSMSLKDTVRLIETWA